MGHTPDDKSEPSLELPSLPGFGRRRKRRGKEAPGHATAEPVPPENVAPTDPPEQTAEIPTGSSHKAPIEDPSETLDQAQSLALPGKRAERRRSQTTAQRPARGSTQRSSAQRSAPSVSGGLAAAVTGILVGAAGAVATYGAMAGCEALRGVSTCGGGPGFLVLVAIFVLMVLLGAGVLRVFRAEAPGSTSFLGVGIVAVVVMLVLLDAVYSPWMFVVVPALAAVAYLLAHWVTTRFDDETGRRDWS